MFTGMKDGQKIVFHGEGDQEPELEPGDVIIVLDQKDHSVFQRRGHDLIMKMKIQLSEALCGFKKTIQTLDERVLVITSKSGNTGSRVLPSPSLGTSQLCGAGCPPLHTSATGLSLGFKSPFVAWKTYEF